jgi:hypothetical protein
VDAETLFNLAKLLQGEVSIGVVPGAPTTGTWFTGQLVLDSNGVLWVCQVGGTPGTWIQATSQWLNPISKSSSVAALAGQYVEATASLTVTSPTASEGARFGAIANYAASNASPVTVTAVSGDLIGPGIPSATTSILLGAENANIAFVCDGTNWVQCQGAQDTGWITATLLNSWVSIGTNPAYRKIGNIVRLRGELESGASGTECFALPASFAPATELFIGIGSLGQQLCTLVINGTACSISYASGSPVPFIDAVSFPVD